MSTAAEIQSLLRFLTQDAKVPLPTAMGKVKELQKANLARCRMQLILSMSLADKIGTAQLL